MFGAHGHPLERAPCIFPTTMALSVLGISPGNFKGTSIKIMEAGSRPTKLASSDWFTGTVWQDPIVEAPEPARVRALKVAFEPGARTAWHTHPLGQTLHVVSGIGLVGLRNEQPQLIKAGDTVWIPPGEEHWHGATAGNSMAHIAIQEALDGRVAEWLDKVSDEDYSGLAK